MLRPTRSRVVTEIDIVCARRGCNLMKTKSFTVQFVGIFVFCTLGSNRGLAKAWAIAKVARAPPFLERNCRPLARL
jgi:hypothetical protein